MGNFTFAAAFRNDAEIKYPFEACLLTSYFLFFLVK